MSVPGSANFDDVYKRPSRGVFSVAAQMSLRRAKLLGDAHEKEVLRAHDRCIGTFQLGAPFRRYCVPPSKDDPERGTLLAMCEKKMAAIMEDHPVILPQKESLSAKCSLTMDPCLAAVCIDNEDYWRRRCKMQIPQGLTTGRGISWKVNYLEWLLQSHLQGKGTPDQEQAMRVINAAGDYIFALDIPTMAKASHCFHSLLLLNNLSELRVRFSPARKATASYDKDAFGLAASDEEELSRLLTRTQTLTLLEISQSSVDHNVVRAIAPALLANQTLTHLNLSHNLLDDEAMTVLSGALEGSILQHIDLSDNRIGPDGAEALGSSLACSQSLESLNMRLNRLGDDGIEALLASLFPGDSKVPENLRFLNVGGNGGCAGAIRAFSALFKGRADTKLQFVDVTTGGKASDEILDSVDAILELRQVLEEYDNSLVTFDYFRVQANAEDDLHPQRSRRLQNLSNAIDALKGVLRRKQAGLRHVERQT